MKHVGGRDVATGVGAGADLGVSCCAVLRVTLLGVDGRQVEQLFRLKVFDAWACSYRGLILGGPALEPLPLGLGFRASLAGHVFDPLGLVCPRLEEATVTQRMLHACFFQTAPTQQTAPTPQTAPTSAMARGYMLCELAESCGGSEPFSQPVALRPGEQGMVAFLEGDGITLEMDEGA